MATDPYVITTTGSASGATHPTRYAPSRPPPSTGLPAPPVAHTAALCCLVMLSAGVPLDVVSEVLDHASVAFTGDVYGHVPPDVSRDALTRLSDALA